MSNSERGQNKIQYFLICKRVFNVAGIYLYKSIGINAVLCIIYYVLSFFLCIFLFGEMLFKDHTLMDLMYTSGFIITYIKCMSIILKRKQLMKVFDTLESGLFLPDVNRGGVEEVELMQYWITYLNKVCLLTSPTAGVIVMAVFIFWIFSGYSKLPFGFFLKIINIEVTAFIQSVCFFIFGTGYLISDVVVFVVLGHLKLHLLNLQNCIKNLISNSINDSLKNNHACTYIDELTMEWKYLKKRLKEVVEYHTVILDVSKLIDEAFCMSHLVKFICLSFLLCLMIYGMSTISVSDGFFWLQCSYAVTLIVLLNVVNYYGDQINIESQNIANFCYNVEFVGTDIKFQKALLLIMQRSQIPITMTVGKFAPLSLTTSIAVMKATYSYFMLLYRH